jgi:hypothetical protein
MTSDSLSQMLSDFLAGARAALVVEDGAVAFDLAESKYSISGEYNKCLLHLWSNERNVVRRVLDAEIKGGTLRLQVQRMGQNRPTKLADSEPSNGTFPDGPLPASPPPWTCIALSDQRTCADSCSRDNGRWRSSE